MTDDVLGWVPGPTERGTLALIWSCVITIFACTWTVLHLNVPGANDTPRVIAWRKAKWMAINVLFPEFVFSKAVCDLRLALQELWELDGNLRHMGHTVEWTAHSKYHDTKYTWEVQYPDGWSGLLYDVLKLDRPPGSVRGCLLRRFLGILSFRLLSVPTDLESTGLALEPRHEIAANDHRRTAAEQPHAKSIHEIRVQEASGQNLREIHAQHAFEKLGRDGLTADTGHDPGPGSPNAPSSGQPKVVRRRRLKWTIVHSYYAQMGGLTFPEMDEGRINTITASHLTRRFKWLQEGTTHPMRHLILEKDDILDKSKADWLLKSLAVFQGAWIISNVIVRQVTQLPISQLEIATVAFASTAVLTCLANWWKPKDISRPTLLHFYGWGEAEGTDRKQSFTRRFCFPTSTLETATLGVPYLVPRVANDSVWLEGDIPLLFYLMAGSSLVFGGVHCLAWNFEFPTYLELICWRVASLASAGLPVVALTVTSLGHLFVHYFWDHYFASKLSKTLDLIAPAGLRQHVTQPPFRCWSEKAQTALLRMPRELRDWEVEPTADAIERWGTDRIPWMPVLRIFVSRLRLTESLITATMSGSQVNHGVWRTLASRDGLFKVMLEENPEILEVWRDYENYLGTKHPSLRHAVGGVPVITYVQQILKVVEQVSTQAISFKRWTQRVTNLVSISNFIVYTAARLVILVLVFTSLRAAPSGLYQDIPWNRFLPKIS